MFQAQGNKTIDTNLTFGDKKTEILIANFQTDTLSFLRQEFFSIFSSCCHQMSNTINDTKREIKEGRKEMKVKKKRGQKKGRKRIMRKKRGEV